MSVVTNVIILHDSYESFRRQISLLQLINFYFVTEENPVRFLSAGDDFYVGGDRNWEAKTYMSAINGLDLNSFLEYLVMLDWRKPENVMVLVNEQHDSCFREVFAEKYKAHCGAGETPES